MKIKNVSITILVICVVLFLFQTSVPGFDTNLVLRSGSVWQQPWTLITHMFLHGGFFHLFINMYVLFMFGSFIENRIGSKRFLFLYAVSGIVAGLGFYVFQEFIMGVSATAVGASGAVMGIIGVTMVLVPDLKVLLFFAIPMKLRTLGIGIAIFEIAFAILDVITPPAADAVKIAHAAHLGGLLAGWLYGQYLLKKRSSFRKKFSERDFHKSKNRKKTSSTEMNDEDIQNYLENGRI